MKLLSLLASFILASVPSFGQVDWSDFSEYQFTLTKKEVESRLQYLQKHADIAKYYQISDERLELFSYPDQSENPEFILEFIQKKKIRSRNYRPRPRKFRRFLDYRYTLIKKRRPKNDFKEKRGKLPLKGLKIILDPGHFGGRFSKLEEKYIDMQGNEEISFNEGDLTLATAFLLQEKLDELGAEVRLTKTEYDRGAIDLSYEAWSNLINGDGFRELLEQRYGDNTAAIDWWLTEATDGRKFKFFFNSEDLKARSSVANDFGAHASISLHYNAGSGRDEDGKNIGTDQNYGMAFVGGAFEKKGRTDELSSEEDRYHFIRLLVTDDFQNSVKLARNLVENISHETQVPIVSEGDDAYEMYLNDHAIEIKEGVFARNLGFTRRTKGASVLVEPLLQDNFEEARKLNRRDLNIEGRLVSSRILDVVEANALAILETYAPKYFKMHRGNRDAR